MLCDAIYERDVARNESTANILLAMPHVTSAIVDNLKHASNVRFTNVDTIVDDHTKNRYLMVAGTANIEDNVVKVSVTIPMDIVTQQNKQLVEDYFDYLKVAKFKKPLPTASNTLH